VNPNVKTKYGRIALHIVSASRRKSLDFVKLLIEFEMDYSNLELGQNAIYLAIC